MAQKNTISSNPFKVLGLDPALFKGLSRDAAEMLIESQRKALQRLYHPDMLNSGDAGRSSRINSAAGRLLELLNSPTEGNKEQWLKEALRGDSENINDSELREMYAELDYLRRVAVASAAYIKGALYIGLQEGNDGRRWQREMSIFTPGPYTLKMTNPAITNYQTKYQIKELIGNVTDDVIDGSTQPAAASYMLHVDKDGSITTIKGTSEQKYPKKRIIGTVNHLLWVDLEDLFSSNGGMIPFDDLSLVLKHGLSPIIIADAHLLTFDPDTQNILHEGQVKYISSVGSRKVKSK